MNRVGISGSASSLTCLFQLQDSCLPSSSAWHLALDQGSSATFRSTSYRKITSFSRHSIKLSPLSGTGFQAAWATPGHHRSVFPYTLPGIPTFAVPGNLQAPLASMHGWQQFLVNSVPMLCNSSSRCRVPVCRWCPGVHALHGIFQASSIQADCWETRAFIPLPSVHFPKTEGTAWRGRDLSACLPLDLWRA